MTAAGLKQLEDELRTLKDDERPAVINAIATAREHGDLKENAEYHAAFARMGVELSYAFERACPPTIAYRTLTSLDRS